MPYRNNNIWCISIHRENTQTWNGFFVSNNFIKSLWSIFFNPAIIESFRFNDTKWIDLWAYQGKFCFFWLSADFGCDNPLGPAPAFTGISISIILKLDQLLNYPNIKHDFCFQIQTKRHEFTGAKIQGCVPFALTLGTAHNSNSSSWNKTSRNFFFCVFYLALKFSFIFYNKNYPYLSLTKI